MSGHVSMMHDVLLTQLPPDVLRSALRTILAQDPAAKGLLASHVRSRLKESPAELVSATELFDNPSTPTIALTELLATARCHFAISLSREAVPLFIHLFDSIPAAKTTWTSASPLEKTLEAASHDVVQLIQAIKESEKSFDSELQQLLTDLLHSIAEVASYARSATLSFPFARAQLQLADAISLLFPSAFLNGHATVDEPLLNVKMAPSSSSIETVRLGRLEVPRLFNGLWQMSSPAWGTASSEKVDEALVELIEAGLVAGDMADHYGDAELLYGSFRNRLPSNLGKQVIAATKWCVFKPLAEPVSEQSVLAAVRERARRLDGCVDLLQFHWQDYSNKDFLPVIAHLVKLTKSHPELVKEIGLCNFDAVHTKEVCEYMLEKTGSVGIVSNQVQYSLIDSRPLFALAEVCDKYNLRLLTYGSFCGGFLSDKFLNTPAPNVYSTTSSLTPSQRKYFDMISAWGSWAEFQVLLQTLRSIADSHSVDISNVSTRWVLQRPEVGIVIVGSRLGLSSNTEANLKAFTFKLTEEDLKKIDEAALGARGKALFEAIGDCGTEYR